MGSILIAGGGIGGVAAALALARVGCAVQLFERQPRFTQAGAGIQLGPNVTRILRDWQLEAALQPLLCQPERLRVCAAGTDTCLASLDLRELARRYGAPWATVLRGDLHQTLLDAVQAHAPSALHLDDAVQHLTQDADAVQLHTRSGRHWHGDALVAADGVHSQLRQQLLQDGPPCRTGHQAFRGLIPAGQLPAALRQLQITVWMGAHLHAVFYPVRAGAAFNAVVVTRAVVAADSTGWDQGPYAELLRRTLTQAQACRTLQALAQATDDWRLWDVHERPPLQAARELARGRVALLGDAAHPMRPYLAQGAGMALEDAQALAQAVQGARAAELPGRLALYAERRWRRNARVQARSIRNGQIYHAQGPLRWGRDLALRALGARLLDQPWLYGVQD